MNHRYLNWNDIEGYIDNIVNSHDSILDINCIVSVGRGGMIPSRLLADRIGVSDVYMFICKSYNKYVRGKIKSEPFNHIIEKKNVLLVDDIVDSGITFTYAYNELMKRNPYYIKTLALLTKETTESHMRASYNGEIIKEENCNDWIVFPWEKQEIKRG